MDQHRSDDDETQAPNDPGDGSRKAVQPGGRPVVRVSELEAIRRMAAGWNPAALEQVRRALAGPLARSQLFRAPQLENLLPKPIELPTARLMADVSQTILGSTSLSGVLAVREATKRIHEVVGTAYRLDLSNALISAEAFRSQLADLTKTADHVRAMIEAGATVRRPLQIERAVAAGSRGWDEATRLLLPDRIGTNLDVVTGLARGAAGVGASGLLLGEDEPEVVVDVVEWGPAPMHTKLRSLLAELHPALPAKLDGAWERVSRPGPDAASQAANSLMELVDWALRLGAPNDDVLPWVQHEGETSELVDGRPTRGLRLKYLARNRPGEASITRLYLRALSDLVAAVQSVKHSVDGKELDAVMSLVPTVEGILFFALRPDEEQDPTD